MAHVHTFAGGWLDRTGDRRGDSEWIAGQRDNMKSRFLPLSNIWNAMSRTRTTMTQYTIALSGSSGLPIDGFDVIPGFL